jgi:hypothetical protein
VCRNVSFAIVQSLLKNGMVWYVDVRNQLRPGRLNLKKKPSRFVGECKSSGDNEGKGT